MIWDWLARHVFYRREYRRMDAEIEREFRRLDANVARGEKLFRDNAHLMPDESEVRARHPWLAMWD